MNINTSMIINVLIKQTTLYMVDCLFCAVCLFL